MKIKNKKNKVNYVNFKDCGVPKKIMIPAGKTVEVSSLKNLAQVLNLGDFERGFFEVIEENEAVEIKPAEASKKDKTEDTLDKAEKEVKNYTDNKKEKK